MTVHFQELETGGVRAAYLTEQQPDMDEVVREALKLWDVEASADGRGIDVRPHAIRRYILEGPDQTVYHTNTGTPLHFTAYTVKVPKDGSPAVVAIRAGARLPEIQNLVQVACIDRDLATKGLAPMESTRDQVPAMYLSTL